jgi:type II secretory ATPase GspE/PulE/Tfp pilus assembly ATPase PilB-like protein
MLQNISDIHINPNKSGLAINFRIDGLMDSFQNLDQSQQAALISRFKVMCGMNIAEKRAPQDGQFSYFSNKLGRSVDIRVASIPTKYGEKLTLRLLDMGPQKLTLSKIGMLPADLQTFRHAIKQPHGIILLTGPTGSGKSTTLYGGLRELTAQEGLNIITIEDPVEYDLDGITQVAVDSGEKVTFAKALRSVLRHDPDVVMIGEIRDAETASIAIKASITGHLVLSTLHTNSAPSVITRLIDMGVERYLVAATLRLAIAQRLVRKLCPHCREKSKLKEDQAIIFKDVLKSDAVVYRSKGCFYCNGKGYKGRVGLFEILNVDKKLSTSINDGISENKIMEYMKENQQKTLLQDAAEKISQGTCSPEEVLRVISVS